MKVILFGATGMVGKGVLLECLDDARVEQVLAVGRSGSGVQHVKLKEFVHADLFDYAKVEEQLKGYDACFFCLGVTSIGVRHALRHSRLVERALPPAGLRPARSVA